MEKEIEPRFHGIGRRTPTRPVRQVGDRCNADNRQGVSKWNDRGELVEPANLTLQFSQLMILMWVVGNPFANGN
jgi:hypothetical protein